MLTHLDMIVLAGNVILDGRPLINLIPAPVLFNFEIIREGDHFRVLDVEDEDMTIGTSGFITTRLSRNVVFTHHEIERLPHDLALSYFNKNRPRRVSEVLGIKHDTTDNRTPDLIGENFIFELGTSVHGPSEAYTLKSKVYSGLAISRGVNYYILGVGAEGTCSNFFLSYEDSKKIVEAYVLGRNIQLKCSQLGFVSSTSVSDMYKEINHSLSSVEAKHESTYLEMSREDWERWSEQTQYTYESRNVSIYQSLINLSTSKTAEGMKVGPSGGYDIDKNIVENYKSEVHSLPFTTKKKRLPIPFVTVAEGNFEVQGMPDTNSEMGELWYAILDEWVSKPIESHYEEYKTNFLEIEEEVDLRLSKDHRTELRNVNRVKVRMTLKAEKLLSVKGYHAKKFNKEEKIDNTQKSYGYHIDRTETDDIEYFINAGSEVFDTTDSNTRNFVQSLRLLEEGGFNNEHYSWELYKWFDTTNLASCLSFLSALFSELNLCYKKPTTRSEFYISQIPGFKALLAVHNTGSSKHTFYTVLVHVSDITLHRWAYLFRPWEFIGNYYALDLCSTRRHDISNLLFCYQKTLTMLATHLEVFSESFLKKEDLKCSKEFLFHLLVYLENNNQTSETLQQVRYLYMKTNESKLLPTPLLSPLEKFPRIIRSRLCLFAIRMIMSSFLKMSRDRKLIKTGMETEEEDDPQDIEVDEESPNSEDFLQGVVSYISLQSLSNYEECLLLSYGGIYHNKEKSDTLTSNFQIYRKLTDEELKLNREWSKEYKEGFTVEDPSNMPDHGFCAEHVRNCAIAILDELHSKGITEKDLVQRMLINLNKISFEEFATFKSSLDPDHLVNGEIRYDDNYNKKTCGVTIRAMEGVVKLVEKIMTDEDPKPYKVFASIMNICNEFGGIVTILFKKAQFGSVREIFILTMFARVVIRLVESISRTIAECCSNEYLTKGREKLNSTPNHYLKIKDQKHYGDTVFNVFDSLDCKTWCQNFTFPAFGQLFSVLLRSWPEASNVTRIILNMASAKRHEMTEVLMKSFVKNPDVNTFSEGMNTLKSDFISDEGGQLNNGCRSIFIKNISNFMQGIFHYTSTIMHSGHMLFMSKIVKSYLLSNRPEYIRGLVHTTKVSSDDSSSLLSIVLKPEATKKERIATRIRMLAASQIVRDSYPLFCAKINNSKSTRSAENGVEEFNSFWTFRNTVLSVPSKFTAAAVCPKLTRSCLERQRVDHNSLNSCIENGCSMRLIKLVEICCALNHYIITGLESVDSETWKLMSNDILSFQHPSSWFYIASPKIIGPTLGFDLSLHSFLRTSIEGRRTQHLLTKKIAGEFDFKSGFMIQSTLMIGKRDKYNKFLKRILPDNIDEIMEQVDMDPYMLHRDSISSSEILNKIYLKAKCPGAERSFIFEDESAVHSLSAYTISRPSMTVSIREGVKWIRKKYTLPSFINMLRENIDDIEENIEVEAFASTILDISKTYSTAFLPIGKRRKVPVKVRFPKTRADQDIPLSSVALFHWFGKSNGRSSVENDEALEGYIKLHSWLAASYSQTRKNLLDMGVEGNIHGVIQGVLHSEFDRDRTIVFLHTGNRQSTLINTYLSCLEYCQVKGCRMTRPEGVVSKSEISELYDLENKIFPFVCIHESVRRIMDNKNVRPIDEIIKIFTDHSELLRRRRTEREVRFLPKRYRNLLAIGLCCLRDARDDDYRHAIMNLASGYMLTYEQEQRKVVSSDGRVSWKGIGKFSVRTKSFNALLVCRDDCLIEVKISNMNQIVQYLNILSKVLKSLKITKSVELNVMDGVRLSRGVLHYTNQKGAKISVLPRTSHVPIERLKIFPELTIEKQSFIRLTYKADIEHNLSRGENIYFNPSQKRMEGSGYQMDYSDARKMINVAASRDEQHQARRFVVESLIDRLGRRHLLLDTRFKRLTGQRMFPPSEEDEEVPILTEEMKMVLSGIYPDSESTQGFENVLENVSEIICEDDINNVNFQDPEVMIDELDLISEEKTFESSPRIYEDLLIWDKFIDGFKREVRVTFTDAIEGEYHMPESNITRTLLNSLISLNVILPPRMEEDEDDEYGENFDNF